jgi:hypothetical protein
MGFESGSMTFRVYEVQGALGADSVSEFARHAAPPITTLNREPIAGWVGPRHLLDREITEETCLAGMYLRVTLMKAERKIPESLLRAHCRLEEQVEMKARGLPYLNRATRREIKEAVVERLLPSMPPSLTGIPAVFDLGRNRAYVQAMSDKQQDAFVAAFRQATGLGIVPYTPEVAALKLKAVNARDLDPVCFAPDPDRSMASEGLGLDFFTWLWFYWESEGGTVPAGAGGGLPFGLMLEGPLTFIVEGEGAHEAVLRKGMPLLSAEAKTALTSGKKLRRAKFVLARGDDAWAVAVDGADFAFRSLKVPKGEPLEPAALFQQRMLHLETLTDVFYRLYEMFLDLRRSAREWEQTVDAMRAWIEARTGRA